MKKYTTKNPGAELLSTLAAFIVLCLFHANLFGQLKKANRFYESYNYANAIPLYEKLINKKKPDPVAVQNLARCYFYTKNYQRAEALFAIAAAMENTDPMNHFLYGAVLKNNNKLDEAQRQFTLYAQKTPSDKIAEVEIKSISEIKKNSNKNPRYDVANIRDLNTKGSEFSPVYYRDGLVFIAEGESDLIHFEKDAWNKSSYYDVYFSRRKDQETSSYKKSKLFSGIINSIYHDGPVCFSSDEKQIYYTRIDANGKKDPDFVNRAKMYWSEYEKGNWTKAKPFFLNNDSYSVGHPSLSPDGQWLFFVSDMPGGLGGKDVYVCKKEGDKWGSPRNLGPEVNTAGNELFPYIRADGMLFFSSDGHGGLGGLDIFSTGKVDGQWTNVANVGASVNSPTDDFGIIFDPDNKTGFFSSNRTGGEGSDDIYSFVFAGNVISLSGKILLSKDLNDAAKNIQVSLLKEDGVTVLKTMLTDSAGSFKFEDLPPDQKYLVKVDEHDPAFNGKKKAYMADDRGRIIRVVVVNEKGQKFFFQNLPADPNALPELPAEDTNLMIAGSLLAGEDPSRPLADTRINLVDEKGNIVQTVTTNAFGAFVFTDLPPDRNYFMKVDESDPSFAANAKIIITNKSGKEVYSTKAGGKGDFKFELLASDKNKLQQMQVEETELKVDLKGMMLTGNEKAIANSNVKLVDEKGNIVATTTTDASGKFVFSNLPADKNFFIAFEENDPQLAGIDKIRLMDDKGKLIKETNNSPAFKFSILASDKNMLHRTEEEDTGLSLSFKGRLTTGEDSAIANSKINLVDEQGNIIATATTDASGKFVFSNLPPDKNFFVKFDERDPQLADLKNILLKDDKNNILREIKKTSRFRFDILPAEKKLMGKVYVDDPWLKVLEMKTRPAETPKGVKDSVSAAASLTIIENIYYNFGEYAILPEGKKTLDKVIQVMKNDPNIFIELSAHTDSRSPAEFNIALSQKRANAAVSYILSSGISSKRITGKGYGEDKLINKCADGVECTEEEHAKNRRTEFKIIRK